MKVIRVDLPPELHEYLTTVIKRYSSAGIDPEEGMILFHLWDFVAKRAQVIELEMAKATAAPVSRVPNDGVSPLQRGDVEAAIPPAADTGIEAVYNNETPHC
jgi:hypothetical protein